MNNENPPGSLSGTNSSNRRAAHEVDDPTVNRSFTIGESPAQTTSRRNRDFGSAAWLLPKNSRQRAGCLTYILALPQNQ